MVEEVIYENRAVGHIETKFLKNKNRNVYIALEEVNFLWSAKHVKEFDEMWNMGFPMEEIAEYFERPEIEVVLLIMSRDMDKKIGARKGGIYGRNK